MGNDGSGVTLVHSLPFYNISIEFYRIEKYRPAVLDDVVGNDEIVSRLKAIAKIGNMPHILLSVDPFFGKIIITDEFRVHRESVRRLVSCAWQMNFWDLN